MIAAVREEVEHGGMPILEVVGARVLMDEKLRMERSERLNGVINAVTFRRYGTLRVSA